MIITCEKCTTRYSVAASALGSAGRKVKCKSCGNIWQQTGDADAGPTAFAPANPLSTGGMPPVTASPERDSVWRKSARVVALMGLLLAVGGLGTVVYTERTVIVGSWPPAALLYQEIGIGLHGVDLAGIPGVGAGLEYRDVSSEIITDAFGATLWIRGEVLNPSEILRPVPTLRVSLSDAEDAALESWTFRLDEKYLDPGATVPFETSRRIEAAVGGEIILGIDEPWSEAAIVVETGSDP